MKYDLKLCTLDVKFASDDIIYIYFIHLYRIKYIKYDKVDFAVTRNYQWYSL